MSAIDRDQARASKSGKQKIYCKGCFANHLNQLTIQDQEEVDARDRVEVRSVDVLTNYGAITPLISDNVDKSLTSVQCGVLRRRSTLTMLKLAGSAQR